MATGYEVAMFRHIEMMEKRQRAMAEALESIAKSLEKIANPILCGCDVWTQGGIALCSRPRHHEGECAV